MNHFLVDTNVVIDMLASRPDFADAACAVFDAAGRGEIRVSICSLSFSNIYYILRRHIGKQQAIESLRLLNTFVNITPVNKTVIDLALYSEFNDFEDAIQYFSALQNITIDGIITRNGKDFAPSEIPVLDPRAFL